MKVVLYIVGGLATLFVGSVIVLASLDLLGVVDPAQEGDKPRASKPGDGFDTPGGSDNGEDPGGEPLPGRPSVRVVRVIDGDTVDTDKLDRVRLIGVNTPEDGRCYSTAATRFTKQRLGGQVVGYELGAERKDRYGRTLAYLYRGENMHDLDLVRKGYAKVLTIPPNDKYADRFRRAAERARRGDEGVWGICERRARRAKARRIARRVRARQRARASARARRLEREQREREAAPPSSGGGGGEDNFNIPIVPGD